MFFAVLAADYDGTIASGGSVAEATLGALSRIKDSGRKLVLVTGRELPHLLVAFPEVDMFDLVVCENGGLLYRPATREEVPLAEAPPTGFVARLEAMGVSPLSVGRVIVATVEPHEASVLAAIREGALEHQIIFNKGAVMVLPPKVNKASGLAAALGELGVSAQNVVGIGDAENDHAFLEDCGASVAVENAIPSLKERADFVVPRAGAGVERLAELLLRSDLREPGLALKRLYVEIGTTPSGRRLSISPFDTTLVTGRSGSGKSTTVTALLEAMTEKGFQFCVLDPEGDYCEKEGAVVAGDTKHEPDIGQVLSLIAKPDVSVVVNMLAVPMAERPRFFMRLSKAIAELRAETGRPHWLIVDEAHHCLPASWQPADTVLPREMPSTIAVTVHPQSVAPAFLSCVGQVVGVGRGAEESIAAFCAAVGRRLPRLDRGGDHDGIVLDGDALEPVALVTPRSVRKRHVRKYAEGELGDDESFYFNGPEGKLNLRAQNLALFVQIADGVDDETWLYHLSNGDYSGWIERAIKDPDLSREVGEIERQHPSNAAASRQAIKAAIEARYTAPAKA